MQNVIIIKAGKNEKSVAIIPKMWYNTLKPIANNAEIILGGARNEDIAD